MTCNTTKPSIYPPYCFNAAPTYNVSCLLRIADVAPLQEYRNLPGVHFYRNLPIRWTRIVGVIVAIDDFPERRIYTIDDSSGATIECVLPLEPRPPNTRNVLAPGPLIPPEHIDFDVGHAVDLRGPIFTFRRHKGIKIRRMKRVPTTQHEMLLWEKRLQFRASALEKPWALSDEEIRKYRKEAERADAKDFNLAGGKRKHKQRRQEEDGRGCAEKDDPYAIKKRGTRPSEKRLHKQGRRLREQPLDNNAKPTAHEEQAAPVSISKAVPRTCGTEEDPYSLKAGRSKRPALSTTSRASPSRKSSSQEDPFKITKRTSTSSRKPPIQPVTLSPAIALSAQEPAVDFCMATKRSSTHRTQEAPAETVGRSQSVQHVPARKPRTQKDTHCDPADDPYVIKSRTSRRVPASKPAAVDQSTYVDPFKITRRTRVPRSGSGTK